MIFKAEFLSCIVFRFLDSLCYKKHTNIQVTGFLILIFLSIVAIFAFIQYVKKEIFHYSHNFSFEFKTRSAHGLVFVTGNFENSALVSAFLVNGTIVFARRCGKNTVFEPHSNITWNDGKWHKVTTCFILFQRTLDGE